MDTSEEKKSNNAAISRTIATRGNRDMRLMEDPANWEQRIQAGCSYWFNTKNSKIRKERPLFRGIPYPDEPDNRYAIGTGSTLYSADEFARGKEWAQRIAQAKDRPATPKLLTSTTAPKPKLPPLERKEAGGSSSSAADEIEPEIAAASEGFSSSSSSSSSETVSTATPAVSESPATQGMAETAGASGVDKGKDDEKEEEEEDEEYSDDDYHDEFEEEEEEGGA